MLQIPLHNGDVLPQNKLETRLTKLEKENLKKEKEISRLKTYLAKEDLLWNTELGQKRHYSSVLPTRLLHTHEMLEYVLSDEKMIKTLTRNTKEVFDDTLEDLSQIIKKYVVRLSVKIF